MIEGDNYPPVTWKWQLAQFFVSFSIFYYIQIMIIYYFQKDMQKNLIKDEEKPSLKLHVFIYFSELCKNGINHKHRSFNQSL